MTRYKRAVLICVAVLFIISLVVSVSSIARTKPVMADFTSMPTIVLDPGHGGLDGGGVNANGSILEKDINLSIALLARDIFIANGFDVVMTRDADVSIHDDGVTGTRNQKTSDLHNRLAIVNSCADPIFISIHQNIYTSPKSWGAQVFYSPNHPVSKTLADILQNDFREMLQPENNRKDKKAGKNLYLMYEAECPAVLVECGFLSNSGDAEKLSREEYRAQVAFTIFTSVMRLLGMEEVK